MSVKEIDEEINKLVREKKLLNESMKRTKNEIEQKGIKKRVIMINAEIRKLKLEYSIEGVVQNEQNKKD